MKKKYSLGFSLVGILLTVGMVLALQWDKIFNPTNVNWLREFDSVGSFADGVSPVSLNGFAGVVNTEGEYVLSPEIKAFPIPHYDEIWDFSEGLAAAHDVFTFRWGFINSTGEEVIPCQFGWGSSFSDGLAMVSTKDNDIWQTGFIDKDGSYEVPPTLSDTMLMSAFSEGLACVAGPNGKFGYIDRSGTPVIPYQFEYARSFSCGLALIKENAQWAYIDTSGTIVITIGQRKIEPSDFTESELACVTNERGEYGYINIDGDLVIPYQYEYAAGFYEGLAKVRKGNKYGYINMDGDEVIPCIYSSGSSASGGVIAVAFGENGTQWGYIDKGGNKVVDGIFSYAYDFSDGVAWVKAGMKYGILQQNTGDG